MSPSSPAGTPDTSLELQDETPNKRRTSGRVRTKPVIYSEGPEPKSNGVKRKRVAGPTPAEDDEGAGDSESSAEEDDQPDEEELKEQRRKAKSKPRKPAAKKSKTTTNLPMRPVINGVKKTSRPKKARIQIPNIASNEDTGLFAEIFSEGHTLESVAAEWIARWNQHNSAAMTDLVNFVIRCTGCTLTVDIHDIEDPDNAVSKLTDLQDEFMAQKPTDYPLISRLKAHTSFRPVMTEFFETLIQACHSSGLLYSDLAIIENIEVWVNTLSSSGMRPFRHTATVISLAIGTQLARVAAELAETTATTTRQKEGEQKQKRVNKDRVKQFTNKLAELERKHTQAKESLTSCFESVFVHRYRDVDPKIRVECVNALGTWIVTYPDFFFEGTYLRYLGWVLSDTFAQTRAEVVKQLIKLYKNKNNIGRLRTFTERFRTRLVEMATRDSEVGIRVSAVDLLTLIRDAGLLEPDDIDNVGCLIFDTEPKVRKAVAGFIADNIQDIFDNSIEELGGMDTLPESISEGPAEDDFDAPRLSWLKFRSVAEAIDGYDTQETEAIPDFQSGRNGLLATHASESRYAACAQTICEGVKETRDWEYIVGYLLHDFSAADNTFEWRCQLPDKEQILMLEILGASVRMNIAEAIEGEADKKGKRTKAQRAESKQTQETIALHLAKVIPDLLKKFGSDPARTSAILRLGQILNLEAFQHLREDSTTYSALLDDINRQFLTNADASVLAEASTALLHARSFEDLEEITQGKVQELWDDTINVLRACMSIKDWYTARLLDICDALRRISLLAKIMDCTSIFQQVSRPSSTRQKKKNATPLRTSSLFDLLLEFLQEPELTDRNSSVADEAIICAVRSLLSYYMWQVRNLKAKKPSLDLDLEAYDFSPVSSTFATVAHSHASSSAVRTVAVSSLLDLHTLFATFRHDSAPLPGLIQPIDRKAKSLILSTFTSLEKLFAKHSRKKLEINHDDDLGSAPEDDGSDSDSDLDSDGDHHPAAGERKRIARVLLAEKRLCEVTGKIVLAIVGRVLGQPDPSKRGKADDAAPDSSDDDNDEGDDGVNKIQKRITRNRTRLGRNFQEVLAYLDQDAKVPPKERKAAAQAKAKSRTAVATTTAGAARSAQQQQKQQQKNAKSKERVDEDSSSDEDDDGQDADEDLRMRELELEDDGIVDPESEEGEEGDVTAGRMKGKGDEIEDVSAEEGDEDEIMGD